MTERDAREIFANCEHHLNGHHPISAKEMLTTLAENTDEDVRIGRYGNGPLIETFESELAELFGKPAALFMPTGTMSQQIALRIWSERKHNQNVVFHPLTHLEIYENMAYRELHGLSGILAGHQSRLMTFEDLQAVNVPFKTLLIELPQREIGGALPTWEDLEAMVEWAHSQDIAVHLDGARIWETKPFYQREYAEIASLFDSIYVSFYKILGGIAGAALIGDQKLIDEARVWRHRHGGNLFMMHPLILSAQQGMQKHLPQMDQYYERAKAVADILSEFPEISITPNPPQTNMMHAYIRADHGRLREALLDVAEEHGIWLLRGMMPAPIPNIVKTELVMGSASLDVDLDLVRTGFEMLLEAIN